LIKIAFQTIKIFQSLYFRNLTVILIEGLFFQKLFCDQERLKKIFMKI